MSHFQECKAYIRFDVKMEDEVVIKGSNDLRMNFSYTDDEVKTTLKTTLKTTE